MRRPAALGSRAVRPPYAERKSPDVRHPFRNRLALAGGVVLAAGAVAGATAATSTGAGAGFHSAVFANGAQLSHMTAKGKQALTNPDDITRLGNDIFIGFQNGVGPQGEASTTGNKDSTIVEFAMSGKKVAQWDVVGKCDGLGADPKLGRVIATVNEDAHSSFYVISPGRSGTAVHYRYSRALPSHGGTDSVVAYKGMVLLSASAPGTTGKPAPQVSYPAVYQLSSNAKTHTGAVSELFSDEATATLANAGSGGKTVKLALTDPDSSATVPSYAPRFAGDFELTSQGDKEQIYVAGAGTSSQSLSVLKLSQSIDDTAWPSAARGMLLVSDNDNGTVEKITGPFTRGQALVAVTPCDAAGAPSTCPGPGFPANYLGSLNPQTGTITKVTVTGTTIGPGGMLFVS